MAKRNLSLSSLFMSVLIGLPWIAHASAQSAAGTVNLPVGSGVYYEIFERSFADSDGDGVGDLNGITARLDYLQSLGISGLWLTPINPSPSYHGYDVTDYYSINPQFGSMADFHKLLEEAHKRHIAVIVDLVINHTSSQHPWFAAAANAADPHHDWYTWTASKTKLDALSATGDGPAWHADAHGRHYLGVFTGAMPDLNYDTPAVREEMERIGRYWLDQGVDGFRLDAAQHIYLDFKSQKNDPAILAKNLAWWSEFRHAIEASKPGAYIVGEVTRDDPEELAPYFHPLSAVFDFPLAEQLIRSAKNERNGDLARLLQHTESLYRQTTGRSGVDAPFLSNHDQNRVMDQLDGDGQHMRMAAAMLLTLPGHPFVYYGEELGMRGSKPDENIRDPMRWYRDDHAPGESHWKKFSPNDDSPAISVQAEQDDPHSLLNFYRQLIGWRRDLAPLRDGQLHSLRLADPSLIGWELRDTQETVLVVHNLSGKTVDVPLTQASLQSHPTIAKKTDDHIAVTANRLRLAPYSTAILR